MGAQAIVAQEPLIRIAFSPESSFALFFVRAWNQMRLPMEWASNGGIFDAKPEKPPLALTEDEGCTGEESEVQEIVVDGNPVKMDKLGPVVVNTDGSISRINNWHEMSELEQKNTLRIIGKRNQQRLVKLKGEAGMENS